MAGAGFELLRLARRLAARARTRPSAAARPWGGSSKAARCWASSSRGGVPSIRRTRCVTTARRLDRGDGRARRRRPLTRWPARDAPEPASRVTTSCRSISAGRPRRRARRVDRRRTGSTACTGCRHGPRDRGRRPAARQGRRPATSMREDWWFRTTFEADAAEPARKVVLRLGGIATVAEVFLNGELDPEQRLDVRAPRDRRRARWCGAQRAGDPLSRLAPAARAQRRPRARWRTRLVADNNLRWFRTMLLGRIPGFAPGRPRSARGGRSGSSAADGSSSTSLTLRPRLDGDDGVLVEPARGSRALASGAGPRRPARWMARRVARSGASTDRGRGRPAVRGRAADSARRPAGGPTPTASPSCTTSASIAGARRRTRRDRRRPGRIPDARRRPDADHDVERDGLYIHVNGVPIFAGARLDAARHRRAGARRRRSCARRSRRSARRA